MRRTCFLIFLAVNLSGCSGASYKLPQVTKEDLIRVEKQLSDTQTPLKTFYRSDEENAEMVYKVTNRLLTNAQPLCNYTGYPSCFFQIVYDPNSTINAFASDGYKITIFKGLLQYLESEDEVAAAIGHEMGHHLAHHNEEKLQNAQAGAAVAGILTAVLIGAANANNTYYDPYQQQRDNQTMQQMMVAGAGIGALSYSKEEEREADLLGAYLLARAGYDLHRAKRLLVVLTDLPGGQGNEQKAGLMDTHPAGLERFVAWEKAIQEIAGNTSMLPHVSPSDNASSGQQTKVNRRNFARRSKAHSN